MIFLFNKITSYKLVSHIKPIIKDGKFINLEVFYEIKNKTYKIYSIIINFNRAY